MGQKLKKPKRSVVEGDEYFYRHPEMMRVKIESEPVEKNEETKKETEEKETDEDQ